MKKNKEIFEKIYEKPGAIWTKEEPPQELVELVESGKIKPGKALDMGCGEGYYSIYLASKGFDVTGMDLSERVIQYAKDNAASYGVNVHFLAMDTADLEKLKEKFDFILEWGLLHHIMPPQWQKYVEDISRLLNSGGKYLSVCFNEQSPEYGTPGEKIRITPLGTKVYYSSQNELKELFEPYFHISETKIIKMVGKHIEHIGNYFFMEKSNHMEKERNNQKQKEKEDECPHCQVSEETLERLKKAGKKEKTNNESTQNQ